MAFCWFHAAGVKADLQERYGYSPLPDLLLSHPLCPKRCQGCLFSRDQLSHEHRKLQKFRSFTWKSDYRLVHQQKSPFSSLLLPSRDKDQKTATTATSVYSHFDLELISSKQGAQSFQKFFLGVSCLEGILLDFS